MKARIVFAAVLSGVLSAPPVAAEPPAIFVNHLYAHYKEADPWSKGFDPCEEYCTADFAKFLKAARKKHQIDYDPVCQCQKGGGAYMMFSGSAGATENDFILKMKRLGDPRGFTLILRWEGGGWKINDVLETVNGKPLSLRQRLAAH